MKYDYIISGAGAAGLSLLMQMMQHPEFNLKHILVVDKAPKIHNDRTWCFWEQQPGLFEPIVHHSWTQLHFYSNQYQTLLNLAPYTYKMIRGIDFYEHVMQKAAAFTNIEFRYGEVQATTNNGNGAGIILNDERYTADYVFNSIVFNKPEIPPDKYYLLQHFKGWEIETPDNFFDPRQSTLMDFRVSQQHGTTFVYVLPVAGNKALVEYTLFTNDLLPDDAYDNALKDYIAGTLNIPNYTITHREFGVIPMTNIRFQKSLGRIINIGTAGGQTKASSGYTFQFIQKQSRAIVQSLLTNGRPYVYNSLTGKRFQLYDSTLLNVLHNNRLGGDQIFSDLFKNNATERVLRFLDNESSLEDEINIMASLPSGIFMKAAFQEMFR